MIASFGKEKESRKHTALVDWAWIVKHQNVEYHIQLTQTFFFRFLRWIDAIELDKLNNEVHE